MPGTWFIGDLHLGHEKVSDIRGFRTADEHDAAIIRRWQRQVLENDTVFVMGDLSSGSAGSERRALEILTSLPGRKRLICGNHDSASGIHRRVSPNAALFREAFEQVNDFSRIRIDGHTVLLSHYPYASQGDGPGRGELADARYLQFRLPDLGLPLVHAHTHHTDAVSGSRTQRELCVSWDAWRRLVNIGDIHRWLSDIAPQEGS